ncbi:MAG: hypothetical protein BMS9Abin36_0654 [Gammaproteobacteria bacterium]|nr:MAG: hypothetical protein BMS9Abin36_0654 [Gammaproteobacteria bacterium]
MTWRASVTVAASVEDNDKFLLVEAQTEAMAIFNQPACHLQAETGWRFVKVITFLRFAFCGQVQQHLPEQALDEGIITPHWMTRDTL